MAHEVVETDALTIGRQNKKVLEALKRRHPWHLQNKHVWTAAEDVLYNQVDGNKESYLPKGEDELPEDWARRLKFARFKGELTPTLHRLVGAVFTRRPARKKEILEEWKTFIPNVDGCHTHLDEFWEDRLYNAWGFGADGILVDRASKSSEHKEKTSKNFESVEIETEEDESIVLVPYRVWQLVDWSIDRKGEPNWVTLFEIERRATPLGKPEEIGVYRQYDRLGFRIFEVKKDGDKEIVDLVDIGSHNLGIVPFFLVGIHRVAPFQFISPMQNAISHELSNFQNDADLQWDSWKHAHPTLIDETSNTVKTRFTTGPNSVIKRNPENQEKASYLTLPEGALEDLRKNKEDAIAGVKRLSGIDPLSGSQDAQGLAASGRSRAVSFSISEERHLKRAARSLIRGERKLFEINERWISPKDDVPPSETLNEHQPTYANIFSNAGTEALIDQWLATKDEINSDAYDRAFQEKIVTSALGDISREELEKILDEIAKNPLKVKEVLSPLHDPDLDTNPEDASDAGSEVDQELEKLEPDDLQGRCVKRAKTGRCLKRSSI